MSQSSSSKPIAAPKAAAPGTIDGVDDAAPAPLHLANPDKLQYVNVASSGYTYDPEALKLLTVFDERRKRIWDFNFRSADAQLKHPDVDPEKDFIVLKKDGEVAWLTSVGSSCAMLGKGELRAFPLRALCGAPWMRSELERLGNDKVEALTGASTLFGHELGDTLAAEIKKTHAAGGVVKQPRRRTPSQPRTRPAASVAGTDVVTDDDDDEQVRNDLVCITRELDTNHLPKAAKLKIDMKGTLLNAGKVPEKTVQMSVLDATLEMARRVLVEDKKAFEEMIQTLLDADPVLNQHKVFDDWKKLLNDDTPIAASHVFSYGAILALDLIRKADEEGKRQLNSASALLAEGTDEYERARKAAETARKNHAIAVDKTVQLEAANSSLKARLDALEGENTRLVAQVGELKTENAKLTAASVSVQTLQAAATTTVPVAATASSDSSSKAKRKLPVDQTNDNEKEECHSTKKVCVPATNGVAAPQKHDANAPASSSASVTAPKRTGLGDLL